MPATRALPLMMAIRPRVCMVTCMRCRSFSGIGAPFSSCRGTASTVMASATTSWNTKPMGEISEETMYQMSGGRRPAIHSLCPVSPTMINRPAAISSAPK